MIVPKELIKLNMKMLMELIKSFQNERKSQNLIKQIYNYVFAPVDPIDTLIHFINLLPENKESNGEISEVDINKLKKMIDTKKEPNPLAKKINELFIKIEKINAQIKEENKEIEEFNKLEQPFAVVSFNKLIYLLHTLETLALNGTSSRIEDGASALQEMLPELLMSQLISKRVMTYFYTILSVYYFKQPLTNLLVLDAGNSIAQLVTTQLNLSDTYKTPISFSINLSLQIGYLKLITESSALQIIGSYAMGVIFQSLAGYMFDKVKTTTYINDRTRNYPATEKFLRQIICDVGFMTGITISEPLYNKIISLSSKPQNNSSNQKQNSNSSNQQQNSNSSDQQKKKNSFPSIKLSLDEEKIFLKDCEHNRSRCKNIVDKVLHLDPSKSYSKKDVKKQYYQLSLWFHPDKRNLDASESKEQTIQIGQAYEHATNYFYK
jgi:hypothetical protein